MPIHVNLSDKDRGRSPRSRRAVASRRGKSKGVKGLLRVRMTPKLVLIVLAVLAVVGFGVVSVGKTVAQDQRQDTVAENYEERVRELQAYGIATQPPED